MHLYEWQAKKILAEAGIAVPKGVVVRTPDEAGEAHLSLGVDRTVVKAQVLSGSRMEGGGIRFSSSPKEAMEAAQNILSTPMKTRQTGGKVILPTAVLVEEVVESRQEIYLGITIDTQLKAPVLMVSTTAGTGIEERMGEKGKSGLFSILLDPLKGCRKEEAEVAAGWLESRGVIHERMMELFITLSDIFFRYDALLLEINPLSVGERLLPLDVKMTIDDYALFRHPALTEGKGSPVAGPTYIEMGGNIGCMVNGAGLAMATMDLISAMGGRPANFLDIGGGATPENVHASIKKLLSNPSVKVLLVNIFGGIVDCALVAEGIIKGIRDTGAEIVIVARFEGNNSRKAVDLLADAGLNVRFGGSMHEGVEEAVNV